MIPEDILNYSTYNWIDNNRQKLHHCELLQLGEENSTIPAGFLNAIEFFAFSLKLLSKNFFISSLVSSNTLLLVKGGSTEPSLVEFDTLTV